MSNEELYLEVDLDDEVASNLDREADPELYEEGSETLRSVRSPLKRLADDAASALFATRLRMLGTAVVVLCSVVLLVWSLFFRLTLLDQATELERQHVGLQDQRSQLELELASFNEKSLRRQIARQSAHIFSSFPHLAGWIESVLRQAAEVGLSGTYTVSQPRSSQVADVVELPIVFRFKAEAQAADNGFDAAMDLVGRMLAEGWHLDVVASEARGTGQGMQQLELSTQVWVFDFMNFVDLAAVEDNDEARSEFGNEEVIQ